MHTIAAISTPLAPGALGVVRISGDRAAAVADAVFTAQSGRTLADLPGYTCLFGTVHDARGAIDQCVATRFRAPKSYTGEDVVELSCHGGPYGLRRLLSACYAAGARPAEPGEFTRRAFLNGKMDLTQAEAVMEMIGAQGDAAAKAARAGLQGRLQERIKGVRQVLVDVDAHLAAWADFPEEGVPEVDGQDLSAQLQKAASMLDQLLSGFEGGRLLREGVETVLAGRPNVGKSTLMNLLAGCEKSIVTSFPGTTRDVVEDTVLLGGVPLRLADTAGLRDAADPVEQLGVLRTRARVENAQLVLAVFDASEPVTGEDRRLVELIGNTPAIAILNKNDLPELFDSDFIDRNFKEHVSISAQSGAGLQQLEKAVVRVLHLESLDPAAGVLFTQRQRAAAQEARRCVQEALDALAMGMTLDGVTISVEAAISALLELTGEKASEAVVDAVFETFCVGK